MFDGNGQRVLDLAPTNPSGFGGVTVRDLTAPRQFAPIPAPVAPRGALGTVRRWFMPLSPLDRSAEAIGHSARMLDLIGERAAVVVGELDRQTSQLLRNEVALAHMYDTAVLVQAAMLAGDPQQKDILARQAAGLLVQSGLPPLLHWVSENTIEVRHMPLVLAIVTTFAENMELNRADLQRGIVELTGSMQLGMRYVAQLTTLVRQEHTRLLRLRLLAAVRAGYSAVGQARASADAAEMSGVAAIPYSLEYVPDPRFQPNPARIQSVIREVAEGVLDRIGAGEEVSG